MILITILLSGCGSNDCCEHLNTEKLPNGVYVEKIRTYCGGVYAGEAYTYYVTDSTSFRWKSGVTSENSYLSHELKAQDLTIYELSRILKESIINIDKFNISSFEKSIQNDKNTENPLIKKNLIKNEIRKSQFSKTSINSEYDIQTYQSFCKPVADTSSYINSVYLVKDSLQIQLVVTYDMKQWTKGYDHYKYKIQDSILIIEEFVNYALVDTINNNKVKIGEIKIHNDKPCQ